MPRKFASVPKREIDVEQEYVLDIVRVHIIQRSL